jgi:hypothetical protein
MRIATTRQYLDQLLIDSTLIEVRCQHPATSKWLNGTFDDVDTLIRCIRPIEGTHNVFNTLNHPWSRVATNTLRPCTSGLKDADMARVTRIPFDIDPARPANMPATDDEVACALVTAKALWAFMHANDWPEPLRAMSGNGYHLQYRVKLDNSDETREQLATIYTGLAAMFTGEQSIFDTTVRNPSRILRLYGTFNSKGIETAERYHRWSEAQIPSTWGCVSRRSVDQLANKLARKTPAPRPAAERTPVRSGNGIDWKKVDIAREFQRAGLYKREIGTGKHAVTCPWASEHSSTDHPHGTDTVVWSTGDSGYPSFHCSHAHCTDRGLPQVIAQLGVTA